MSPRNKSKLMNKTGSLVVAATLTWFVSNPDARTFPQQESLRDVARRNGGRGSFIHDADPPFFSLEDLASKADVIVHGRIESATGQLSKDETWVRTAFAFQPLRIMKAVSRVNTATAPGPTAAMVFTMSGGTVLTEGLTISMTEHPAIDPPVQAGDEVIAFLTWDSAERIFRQPYGPAGLLFVREGRVVAASKDYARLRPLPDDRLNAVIDEIQKMAREGRIADYPATKSCWRVNDPVRGLRPRPRTTV